MFRQWRQLQTRDFADKGAACPPPGGRSPASLAQQGVSNSASAHSQSAVLWNELEPSRMEPATSCRSRHGAIECATGPTITAPL